MSFVRRLIKVFSWRCDADPFWILAPGSDAIETIIDMFPDSCAPDGCMTVRVIHRDKTAGVPEIMFHVRRHDARAFAQFILRRLREHPETVTGNFTALLRNQQHGEKEGGEKVAGEKIGRKANPDYAAGQNAGA